MYSTMPPKPTGIAARRDALEFPGIAVRQPVVRHFFLPAVMDALLEQAVLVTDTVAEGGDASAAMLSMKQAASRPSPPLPSAGIGLELAQVIEIDAKAGAARCASCRQDADWSACRTAACRSEIRSRDNRRASSFASRFQRGS